MLTALRWKQRINNRSAQARIDAAARARCTAAGGQQRPDLAPVHRALEPRTPRRCEAGARLLLPRMAAACPAARSHAAVSIRY